MERFWDLPYNYVIDAVARGRAMFQRRLHLEERPVAVVSSLLANQQRDSKRQRKPFSASDFYLYQPREDKNLPEGSYGAAAVALANAGRLPSWCLFCYPALKDAASACKQPPHVLAYIAEDAILLAPRKLGDGYIGMLVAQESAGNQVRLFETDDGNFISLDVPAVPTKFIAEEDVILLPPGATDPDAGSD